MIETLETYSMIARRDFLALPVIILAYSSVDNNREATYLHGTLFWIIRGF